jgi:hypothetical protein
VPAPFSGGARDLQQLAGTRHATRRREQDSELIERTQALDELKILERKALADVERQQQACSMPARPKRGRSAICRNCRMPPRKN